MTTCHKGDCRHSPLANELWFDIYEVNLRMQTKAYYRNDRQL